LRGCAVARLRGCAVARLRGCAVMSRTGDIRCDWFFHLLRRALQMKQKELSSFFGIISFTNNQELPL
jgi:hypothetical protein